MQINDKLIIQLISFIKQKKKKITEELCHLQIYIEIPTSKPENKNKMQ